MAYSRARSSWADYPAGGTPVQAAHLNQWDQAIYDLKTVALDPRDYGAVGDGTTNEDAAFAAMLTDLETKLRTDPTGSDGAKRVTVKIKLSAGSYLLTANAALMRENTNSGVAMVRGLIIEGAGAGATQIIYTPAASNSYLMDATDTWIGVEIRDIEFVGSSANANLLKIQNSSSTYFARQFTLRNCTIQGSWTNGVFLNNLTTANNADTCNFFDTAVGGTWAGSFFSGNGNDNELVHLFDGVSFEVVSGTFINMTKGGAVTVNGGSLVYTGGVAATFIKLMGASHSEGACRFTMVGTRVELRDVAHKLLYCEWPYGAVTFLGVDDSAFSQSLASTVNTQFDFSGVSGPTVTWTGCRFQGKHEYIYRFETEPVRVLYQSCEFRNGNDVTDVITLTPNSGGSNAGAVPVISFRNCRGTAIDTQQYRFETDLGWRQAMHGLTQRKVLSIRDAFNVMPFAGEYTEFVLPLNAVVVGLRLYAPAFGTSTQTTWSLKLQTTEGTPTTIYSLAPGTQLKLGFDSGYQTLWSPCDADNTRTLRLVSNAALDQFTTSYIGIVEYI